MGLAETKVSYAPMEASEDWGLSAREIREGMEKAMAWAAAAHADALANPPIIQGADGIYRAGGKPIKPGGKMATQGWADDVLSSGPTMVPMVTSGPPMTALIDGDLIAYRSAAATQGTYYKVQGPKLKGTFEHKYYKDALKAALDAEPEAGIAKTYIGKHSNPEPLSHSIHNMRKILDGITIALHARYGRPVELEIYLTADVLFRDDVTPLYKKSREGIQRPENLKGSKEWLTKTHGAMTVNGYEADDLLAMYATELGPLDCVVVSLDKDLLQIPGDHYDFAKGTFATINSDEARRNFWTQALIGDKTDDIPGLHGVGPVTARKILASVERGASEQEFYKVVLKEWCDRSERNDGESDSDYYSRIIQLLSKSCKLLWLCREPEAIWQPPVSVSSDSK